MNSVAVSAQSGSHLGGREVRGHCPFSVGLELGLSVTKTLFAHSSYCLESGHVAVPARKDAWGLRSSAGVDRKSGQLQRPFRFLSLSIVPPAGRSFTSMTPGIFGHLVLALTLFQHVPSVEMPVSLLQRDSGSVALANGSKLSLQSGLHLAIELYFFFPLSLLD